MTLCFPVQDARDGGLQGSPGGTEVISKSVGLMGDSAMITELLEYLQVPHRWLSASDTWPGGEGLQGKSTGTVFLF